jgi:hypothetical protein
MATRARTGMTVTPIFWEPAGGRYVFPAGFVSVIHGFLANIAAASGSDNNFVSVTTEYYQDVRGLRASVHYDVRALPAVVDTTPFPPDGCTPDPAYTTCISDSQLRSELRRVTSARGLPTDLSHFYPVFLPPKVQLVAQDGTRSGDAFCGYHLAFPSGHSYDIYSGQPYPGDNCITGQAPNGNAGTDGTINILSHELDEVLTDPLNAPRAWDDKSGNEVADMCNNTFGRPLGSTNAAAPQTSEYNQIINGGRYYLQQEFSNDAYAKFGVDKGCVLSEALAANPAAAGKGGKVTSAAMFFLDATPTAVAADGTATSTVDVQESTAAGQPVAGDRVHFVLGVQSGGGDCGTLSSEDATTAADGRAQITYTASHDNVACWLVAEDAKNGNSAEAVIYQGTTRSQSPAIHDSLPASLKAGGAPVTFTITAANPFSKPLPDAVAQIVITPGRAQAKAVTAQQVQLSYSSNGSRGAFLAIPLTGSTRNGDDIEGYLAPSQLGTLARASSRTVTFHVTLARTVPVSRTAPLLAFQASLAQLDPASGSGSTLADTNVDDIKVAAAAKPSSGSSVAVAAGALLAALLGIGLVMRRTRTVRPDAAAPAET